MGTPDKELVPLLSSPCPLNLAQPSGSSVDMVDSQTEKSQAEDNHCWQVQATPYTYDQGPLLLSSWMTDFRFLQRAGPLKGSGSFTQNIALWVANNLEGA